MNCKPGDLAVIVPGPPPHFEADLALVGTIVRVTHIVVAQSVAPGQMGAQWAYEGRRLYCNGLLVVSLSDLILRPITPPPNTVTDDEVRELYEPAPATRVKETA